MSVTRNGKLSHNDKKKSNTKFLALNVFNMIILSHYHFGEFFVVCKRSVKTLKKYLTIDFNKGYLCTNETLSEFSPIIRSIK